MIRFQTSSSVLELARRWIVVMAVSLWFGGFLFYTAFVVPVGTEVLGSAADQGMITRRVTVSLNAVAAVALALLLWDAVATWRSLGTASRISHAATWLIMLASLLALLWLHPRLDALIDPRAVLVHDRAAFRPMHRWYLRISTLQWAAMLPHAAVMLAAWRARDRAGGPAETTKDAKARRHEEEN